MVFDIKKNLAPSIFFWVLLVVTYFVYQPGLGGGFLFDDYSNLEELGTYGGVIDLETFKSFVFNGISSPMGRPISLASFLLDDNTWPTNPEWFKVTNLKIHLLNGVLLCWVILLLMRLLNCSEGDAVWIALVGAGLWMLHPYMVSTTLYIVQRMALLSAMFMMVGLCGYLYGRKIAQSNLRLGLFCAGISLTVCTILAVLCKENGLLLPLGVLMIELCVRHSLVQLPRLWSFSFLYFPALLVLGVLIYSINYNMDAMPGRTFSQYERVITQPRIISEYLYHLFIPRIEGRGLFQDGYKFSKSLFSPASTFFAIVLLGALVFLAIKIRRRCTVISIAILFFLINHLLESTWLNLELYFEHRNYIASILLFVPIAMGLIFLKKKISLVLVIFCGICIFSMLSFLTYKRTSLWSDSDNLETYWAVSTPESPRAQNRMAMLLVKANQIDKAIDLLTNAEDKFKDSSLITINLLLVKVYADKATSADFINAGTLMQVQSFDAQAVKGLHSLVDVIIEHKLNDSTIMRTIELLATVRSSKAYQEIFRFKKLSYYLEAKLYLQLRNYHLALDSFLMAMDLYNETDAALSMVAEMANEGGYAEALILLEKATVIYQSQPVSTLKRSVKVYDYEFERMRKILELAKKETIKQTEE